MKNSDKIAASIFSTANINAASKIMNSKVIACSNLVQHAVTIYPSIQYVTDNILGFKSPNIHWGVMVTSHLLSVVSKIGVITGTYSAEKLKNAPNINIDLKLMFIQIAPTATYFTKLAFSEIILKPITEQPTLSKYTGAFCSALGFSQYAVDKTGEAITKLVIGRSTPTSMFHGTAYTAISCMDNDGLNLDEPAKTASLVGSLLTGTSLFYYLHNKLDDGYNNYAVIDNVFQTISSIAVAHIFIKVLFIASASLENDLHNDALISNATCMLGENSNCTDS